MLDEDLARANIENLIAFWTACGTDTKRLDSGRALHRSQRWPGRLWIDARDAPDAEDLDQLLSAIKASNRPVIVPCWPAAGRLMETWLGGAGLDVKMRQELMTAPIDLVTARPSNGLRLLEVDAESAALWAQVAGESFGYRVDETVIASLIGRSGLYLYLAEHDGAVVGTGLLAQTGDIVGVHMVGVPPSHRRRGYARQIMFGLLDIARGLGGKHLTLQASAAAEPLYGQLGFTSQGQLRSYHSGPKPTR